MSEDKKNPVQPVAPGEATAPVEDLSTQALSEALHSSFRIVKIVMVGLVALFLCSGMFTVEPNEVAVKLRFGRPVGDGTEQLLLPGWHWAFPYPLDEVVKIPVGRTYPISSTAGWYRPTPDGKEPPPSYSLIPGVDGYAITADRNIIHVRAAFNYQIIRPLDYAFNFINASNVLQHVLDNAIYYASARFTAEEAIYGNQAAFRESVLKRVNDAIDQLRLGVKVEPSEVLAVAPADVRAAFNDVLAAKFQASTNKSGAEAYALSLTNYAAAQALSAVNDGLTASNRIVQSVSADAKSFKAQLEFYTKNPELRKQFLLTETMGRVLTNSDKWVLPPGVTGQTRTIWLQLNPEAKRSKFQQLIQQK